MTPRSTEGDEGNVSILTLGFAVLALAVILVGAAATGLHLDRMRLVELTDEVAEDCADAMDVASYYAGEAPEPDRESAAALANPALRAVAERRTADRASDFGLSGVRVVEASSPDGRTADVTLSVVVRPLFGLEALLPWVDGVTLTATSSARAY